MGAELGLLSLTHLQKLSQSQHNQYQNQHHQPKNSSASSLMWNPDKQQAQEDDDSWEVRAFAEDTGNIMGTTWPPRSYTCTFCRREFRSAQALGGHMNVHRRDRARLHQNPPPPPPNNSSMLNPINTLISPTSASTSTFLIPAQEFSTNGGLCLLYQLPKPNSIFTPANMNTCAMDSPPPTLLSISPYSSDTLIGQSLDNFPGSQPGISINSSSHSYSTKAEPSSTSSTENIKSSLNGSKGSKNCRDLANGEELDLELRLGHRSSTSSSS